MNISDMSLVRSGMIICKEIRGEIISPFSMLFLHLHFNTAISNLFELLFQFFYYRLSSFFSRINVYFYSSTFVYSITKSTFLVSELVGIVNWKLVSPLF